MNAISYIRNVGKSFGYIAVDVIKDYNPAATAFAQSAKDLGSELYQSVSDFKSNLTTKASEINLKDEAKSITHEIGTNLFDDLKTGKWYNADRVSKAALAEFESFGDFSFGDDDFGDFEFEDDEDNSTKAEMAQDQMNTRALINSMDVVGAKTANAVNTATVRSAEYVVTAQRESTRALYGITSRGFGEVTKGLAAINSGVASLASIAEPINIHIQNSTNFYTRSTEYQEKTISLLEQLVKNTSATHPATNKSSRQKNTVGDFMMDGAIDLMAYYEMVSTNIKDMVGLYGSFLGGGMGGGIKNSKLVKSPVSTLLKAGVKGLTPKIMKKSMEEFNEYLDGFFSTMLGSLRDKNVSNPILALLKDFFVPKSGYKKNIDTGNYNKGKVDWDGMSRKALMDVIPYQLSQIVSALTGRPQELFDYKTGKWIKSSTIKSDFEKKKDGYADSAGYEFVSEVKAVLRELKNQNKLTDEQLSKMSGQVDKFNRIAYHSDNSEFVNFMDDGFDFSKYGLDRSTWNVLKAYAKDLQKNGKRSKIRKYTGNIMTDRARLGNEMLDLEADGSSIYNVLFNGSALIDENERGRTLLGVDQFNNDIFFYLQGIYQSTTHVSDNLHLLIPNGRSTKGTKIDKNAKISPIRSITRKDRVNTSLVDEHRSNVVDLNSLDAEQLEELLANMNDKTKSGKKLPPKSNTKLREYAMKKYNSVDGNYEKDETLEKQLEAWEQSDEAFSGIKEKFRNTTIGKTVLNFSESVLKLLNTPAEAVTKLLNAAEVSMDRLLTGNKEDGEKGILDLAKEGFTGLFESLNDKLNNIFPIDKMKGFMDKVFGAKGADGKRHGSSLSGFANSTGEELAGVGRWFKNIFTGGGSVDQAAKGRKVTRTGLVAVSEGELIIPSELNPFYKGKTNKRNQIARENKAIGRFFGAYSNGTTGVGIEGEQPLSKDGTGKTSNINDGSILAFLLNALKDGGKTLAKGAGEVFENIIPNQEQAKKEKGKIGKVVESALKDLGASKGAIGAGALIGGGVSLLTGGLISPILGAGIGAAGGLIVKSKAVQEALFGTETEEGLFKKETAEFIKKHVPDMGKGAAVGGAAGLFMGSPVMGALLGSAVGYIKSSTEAREYLFGGGKFGEEGTDSGIISKDLQKKIKKAVPSMSAGAILGLVAGPFGSIPANLILGSALGFATDTDKLKKWMFGEKDKDGNKTKSGFVDLLRDKFINPLVDIFTQIGEQIKHTVRDTFHNLSKALRKTLTDFLKGGIGRRVVRGAKAVGRGINKVTGGLFNKIGDGIVGVRDFGRNRALRKGYNVFDAKLGRNLTATERRELRETATENGRRAGQNQLYDRYDEFLMNANAKDINEVDAELKKLIDPTKEFDNQIRKSRSKASRILENSRNKLLQDSGLTDNMKKDLKRNFDKVYKFISDGEFDQAREWASKLHMDEDTRKSLLDEINKSEEAFKNRDIAVNDSDAGRKALLGDSKWRHIFGDRITDSDLMNLRDLNKTELKHLNTPEAKLEQSQEATVEIRDIAKNILTVMVKGPESVDPKYLSGNSVVKTQQIINDKYDENGKEYKQGDKRLDTNGREMFFDGKEWNYNMEHDSTRKAIEREEKLEEAIVSTAENTKSLTGMDKLLGFMGNGNPEEEVEETKGLFDNFNFSLKNVLSSLTRFGIGLAGFWSIASGKLDDFFNKLGWGGKAGNETILGSTGKVDQQGNELIEGEDGKYYNADGTEYTGEVYAGTSDYSRATTPIGSKFLFNEARQLLTRGKNFGTKLIESVPILGKKFKQSIGGRFKEKNTTKLINTLDWLEKNGVETSKINKILDSASSTKKGLFTKAKNSIKNMPSKMGDFVKENIEKITKKGSKEIIEETTKKTVKSAAKEGVEEAVEQATKKQMMEYVQEAVEKLVKNVDNFPFGKKLFKSIDLSKFGKKLVTAIGEKVAKASARAVADCAYAFPPAGVVLDVVFFVTDFIGGWNDATEYFKVLKATTWMKLVSALATSLFGLIPFVGPLIPVGQLISIIVDVIGAIDPDAVSELRSEQASVTAELDAYNKYHFGEDTDKYLDYSDYSKNEAGNKGFLEKGWDFAKTWGSAAWNTGTENFKNITTGEYGDSFGSIISGMIETSSKNYNSTKWREYKDRLELELRTEMRENGGVDETKLQELLRSEIDSYLYSEEGAKYYRYEYDETKQSYEQFRSKYEAAINKHTSSSNTTYSGGSKRRNSNTSGSGTGVTYYNDISNMSAGSSGLNNFVSQLDSKYANMSIGGINDVQSKGCGPAAAVMALNQYAGNANMNSAVKVAGNYQTGGGTDAAFFADYYKKHGVNASYYDGTSSAGQSNIINSINNGVPVVLMGRDFANTSKANSPFGPNNHYVVASGFDGSGNIIINDPESRRSNKKYSTKILKNVKLGIGMSGAGSRIFRRFGFSGGSTTYSHELRNDAATQMVWSILKSKGYSDAAVAGIMGNLQQESGIDPTRHQMNGGPGRGLAQWSVGERHDDLIKFAEKMGRDWTDLEAQVLFIDHEICGSQRGFFKNKGCEVEKFKKLDDPAYATEIFEKAYERAGIAALENRIKYAVYYYNEFSGKTYEYSGNYTPVLAGTTSDSTTENQSSTQSLSVLDNIFSFFDNKLGSLFGIKNYSTTTTSSTSNNEDAVNANPKGITYSGSTPVELMKSINRQVKYSMNGPRDPEQGSADCSSTVRWAIKKATGIDIGNNTAAQYNNGNLETVWYNNGNIATSLPNNIKENDVLFFSRPNSNYTKDRKDRVGHVELYAGNNQMIGHGGGGDGWGPTLKNLTLKGNNGGLIKVARVIGNSAAGSGLVDASTLGKTSKAIYNRGASNIVEFNPSTGTYTTGTSKLYSGGGSKVNVKNTNVSAGSSGISKDVALLLKTIITLIETLVSNTDDIHNIYEVLVQFIDGRNIDANTASKAKVALNSLNTQNGSSSSSKIESQLSGLKAQVDSILAS